MNVLSQERVGGVKKKKKRRLFALVTPIRVSAKEVTLARGVTSMKVEGKCVREATLPLPRLKKKRKKVKPETRYTKQKDVEELFLLCGMTFHCK